MMMMPKHSKMSAVNSIRNVLLLALLLPLCCLCSLPCAPRQYPTGIVCVCNSSYCDELDPSPERFNPDQALVYTSSESGKRFELAVHNLQRRNSSSSADAADDDDDEARANATEFDAHIDFDTDKRFQQLLGFGGAFTDAVAINLKTLSAASRKKLLKSYFGQTGIGYTLGRVPIASCDFSTHVYSYCDVDGDFRLEHFALAPEDLQLKIPLLHEAIWLTNGQLQLFASPWSAPGWMKETGRMQGGGPLKGQLLIDADDEGGEDASSSINNSSYYASWALYLVRFFEEYLKRGIQFWGLTLQNEPSAGLLKWYPFQAMYLSAAMQRDFVKRMLGPLLRNSSTTGQLKLMINDDNRAFLPSHPDLIFADPEASKYIDGVAVHWYWNKVFSASRLAKTHERHPDKFILPTEACNGWSDLFTRKKGVLLGDWWRGEKYARDIIENLENWAVGWTDWNLCLNEQGGPSWARNWADSPIIVNGTGAAGSDEFYKQPMYYAIGHFSKFMPPGSVRVSHRLRHRFHWDIAGDFGLAATAVLDMQRSRLVLVLQNRHKHNQYRVRVQKPGEKDNNDNSNQQQWLELTMERRSLATVLFQL